MKLDNPPQERAASPTSSSSAFNFLEKLVESVPTTIMTTSTDLYQRTAQAVPTSVTSAVTSTVQSIKTLSEPLVAQHRDVLVSLDGYACKGLDHSLNAIHNTAKTVNVTIAAVENKVSATRTSVEATVASARSSADAHLATIESTALALAAPVIVSSVNAVDNAIERFIPSSSGGATATTTEDAAATTDAADADSTGEDAGEQVPEYQFAPLPVSPKSASALPMYNEDEAAANTAAAAADAAAAAAGPAAAPFGTETKKLLKQIEAVCTKAKFRARERALAQVQYATARTEAVVTQLKTNTVDLLAYAKKIGADGYGYVTSEEAAADAKAAAAKASEVAAEVAAKAKVVSAAVVTKAEEAMPAPVVDQAKRVATMLTAYYAAGLDLAKQHEVAEKVTDAAAVFYGHVERLTRGEHRDQVLAFLLRRTQADAAAAAAAAASGGGGGGGAAAAEENVDDLASATLVPAEANVEVEAEADAVQVEAEEEEEEEVLPTLELVEAEAVVVDEAEAAAIDATVEM